MSVSYSTPPHWITRTPFIVAIADRRVEQGRLAHSRLARQHERRPAHRRGTEERIEGRQFAARDRSGG